MSVERTVHNHKIQPTVELLNIPEPTKPVRNARLGIFESAMTLSQSCFEILPLRYSKIALLHEAVYPPSTPRKYGVVALSSTPRIYETGFEMRPVRRRTAPVSVAISDMMVRGKSEGMSIFEQRLSAFLTSSLAKSEFFINRASKKMLATVQKVPANVCFVLRFALLRVIYHKPPS